MPLNLSLFEELKEIIRAEYRRVSMPVYLAPGEDRYGSYSNEICNSVGCIAGHTVLMKFGDRLKITSDRYGAYEFTLDGRPFDEHQEAGKLLGLTEHQAYVLFIDWPRYINNERPKTPEYAEAVCQWIDEFIRDADLYENDPDE